MSDTDHIVILGGGHAGAALCNALAGAGLGTRVHLVCEEAHLPYHRPPLSKAFLKTAEEALQWHRAPAWFEQSGITVHSGDAALSIDRAARTVTLRSGKSLSWSKLVIATGTRARALPGLPAGLSNVCALRTADDAIALRERLHAASRVTLIGGGFIGLEIAATARALGKEVCVLEAAPRLLARSVSPELAQHVLETHRAAGIDLRLGVKVDQFTVEADRLVSLCVDGERQAVDLLIPGIGATPEDSLARAAGLQCDNGVVVDASLRTSDPDILAIGDCANFPRADDGQRLRLESVQNANDQARTALATLQAQATVYAALPWFWSEQGSMRLQMAGLMPADGERHRRPGATPASFSILHYREGRLACVESVNAPADHIAARKLLESGKNPPVEQACDPGVALKTFA